MKQEEELLAMLRAEIKDERSKLEDWERVARGEAAPTELAALADDPDSEAMLEACKPLGEDAQARIEARIKAARGGIRAESPSALSRGASTAAPTLATPEAPLRELPASSHAGEGGQVVALPRRVSSRWSRIVRIVGPLAAAAAIVLAIRLRANDASALPAYEVTAVGGSALVRGDTHETRDRLTILSAPEESFELVARPATAIRRGTTIHAYPFTVQGEVMRSLAVRSEIAGGGSIRLRGQVESLGAATEIRIVVSDHPLDAQAAREAAASRDAQRDSSARVLRIALDRPTAP